MNEKQITFIICTNNAQYYNECVYYIEQLIIPDEYSIDVLCIQEAESMAEGYNAGMHASNAKYKVYLHQDTFIINPNFLSDIIEIFTGDNEIGMIGVIGADILPKDACCYNSWNTGNILAFNGYCTVECNLRNRIEGKYSNVGAIDGLIMVTQYDIEWREDILTGWDFYDVSQSLEMRRHGYKVVVPYVENPWCYHDCGVSKLKEYDKYREAIIKEYPEVFEVEDWSKVNKVGVLPEIEVLRNQLIELVDLGEFDTLATLYPELSQSGFGDTQIREILNIVEIYISEKHLERKSELFELEGWKNICEYYKWIVFMVRRIAYGMADEEVALLKAKCAAGEISSEALKHITTIGTERSQYVYALMREGDIYMNNIEKSLESISGLYEHIVQVGNAILNKMNQGISCQQEIAVMAEAMSSLASIISGEINSDSWTQIYAEMKKGQVPDYFADRVAEWEDLVCEWMEQMEDSMGTCNMCGDRVFFELASGYIAEKQKECGYPYWNSVMENVGKRKCVCPSCKSLDRERMMALFLELLKPEDGQKMKVLHIAPSDAMSKWLHENSSFECDTIDLCMDEVTYKADVQDMYMIENDYYDIVICSNVLGGVKDDRGAMAEIKRVLKEDGLCLFVVPLVIGLDSTDEEVGLSEEENWKRFGWRNFTRIYAKEDFLNRLSETGYLVHILDEEYFGKELWKQAGLTDIHCLYVATKIDIGIGVAPYVPQKCEQELVSVVIPTHNRGYCIERAIHSVLNQTWHNLELIIVDDASTDNTESVVGNISDNRLRYIKLEKNGGANHARNVGIQHANGNYVAFNDSDDEWLPKKLEKQIQLMKLQERIEGEQVGAVYCVMTKYKNGEVYEIAPQMEILSENGMGDIYEYLQGNMFISTQTLLFRKKVLEDVGFFDENLKRLQDWELLLRVAQKYKFYLVQENLVDAYVQEDCISNNNKGWIDTALHVIELHDMSHYNRNAYKTLVRVIVKMLKKQPYDEAYFTEVVSRIEKDGVYTNRQIVELKKEVGLVSEGAGSEEFKILSDMIKVISELTEKVQKQEQLINRLYANYNVRKGWQLEINKEKINYELEKGICNGVCNKKRDTQLIVSLTSYPGRMYDLKYTLYSLLNQSLKPDRIILWLAKEQYPNLEDDIAPSLLALKNAGLEIMWCEDIKSYKKLIPSLKMFPDDIIVTADDDIYYPENWLEVLYNAYLKEPNCVHAHRAHIVKIDGDKLAPYNSWEQKTYRENATYYAFPTSGGGVLYPPHMLHDNIFREDEFMSFAPKADDVWFWAMCVLNGTKIKIVKDGYPHVISVNYAREIGLCEERTLFEDNVGISGGNNFWLDNVLSKYPQLMDVLREEKADNWEGSARYWENRYVTGGNSGAGSYNRLADFKARIINEFVKEHDVKEVVEWGCGDGNQLSLATYPAYVGFDVSKKAVQICEEKFKNDTTKKFVWSGGADFETTVIGDLAMSLDVIYHLVEDEVFELYMQRLFASSDKYICIYACDFDSNHAAHVQCRKFTDYIADNFKDWELLEIIPNEYPYDENDPDNTSWSDFYFYKRKA